MKNFLEILPQFLAKFNDVGQHIGFALGNGRKSLVPYYDPTAGTLVTQDGVTILGKPLGTYATLAALTAAYPAAANLGAYAVVGTAAPYVMYASTGTLWRPITQFALDANGNPLGLVNPKAGSVIALGVSSTSIKAWRPETYFAFGASTPFEPGLPNVSFTGVIAGTVLTASAVTGTLAVGQFIQGDSVRGGTYIVSLGTGTGGAGTYNLSGESQTIASRAMTVDTNATAVTTDLNFTRAFKVVRRAGRFRLGFTSGPRNASITSYTVTGQVELPTKNGSPALSFVPITFYGQPSFLSPAGGGTIYWSDWISWPLVKDDVFYVKMRAYNGGTAFVVGNVASASAVGSRNASGVADYSRVDLNVDYTGYRYGASPWTSSTGSGVFSSVIAVTDSNEGNRPLTVDIWGDSIGFGAGSNTSTPFLEQVLISANIPFQNLAISSTNQAQIPQFANARTNLSRGDIAIVEHGRNNSSTAALSALWTYLRTLGYRKIIQTTTTNNVVYPANNALQGGGDSSAMRAFQRSNVGVGDGPDVLWDAQAMCQDQTTGFWLNVSYTGDGLHPNDLGNTTIANGLIAAGVVSTLS